MNAVRALASVNAAAALNVVLVAALGVLTARFLGPAGQGSFTLITTITALVILVCAMGTGASLRLRARPALHPADVAGYAGLTAVLAVLAAVLATAGVLTFGAGLLSGPELGLTALLGATTFVARQSADYVQARGCTARSILALGIGVAGQIVSFAGLALAGPTLTDAILSGVIGATCQALAGVALARGTWDRHALAATHIWRELIRTGSPSLGYGVGLLTMQRLDRLLLVALVDARAAGLYAVAATIAEAARFGCASAGQLIFVRTAAAQRLERSTRSIYRVALASQATLLAALALAAPVLVPLVFGSEYGPSVGLLRGLLIAELFMGAALLDSRIIMGLGRLTEIGLITLAACGLALALYPPLISRFGAGGAVLGSITVYATYAATLVARVHATPRSEVPSA